MKSHPGFVSESDHLGGKHWEFRFANGYGASVVCHTFSYGGKDGLFELGVIKAPRWELTYDTPITDGDVIGYLSREEVFDLLDKIAALPPVPKPGGMRKLRIKHEAT